MTKQRSRPSLGQAALMTGLLGVGGWLASSAFASNDANASELPPDPGSYAGTVLPDPGSIDLKQLSNSVLDQVAQLRANGHDFSVEVARQGSDQIPAALRRSSDQDSKSREAWKTAGQRVADVPSPRVAPRSSTPVVTPIVPSSAPTRHSDSDSDSVPVTPTGHSHGRNSGDDAGSTPSQSDGTTDRRDEDQKKAPATSVPPIAAVPLGDVPAAPSADATGSEPPPADPPTGNDDNDATGTGGEPRTGIPDGAKERSRLGGNNKDSLQPGEIKDAGVESTLFSKEQDISKAVDQVQQDLASGKAEAPTDSSELPQVPDAMPESGSDSPASTEPPLADIMNQLRGLKSGDTQTFTGTAQPLQGPEALPGTESGSGLIGVPATAAVVWQQLNQRVFDPVKARIEAMKELRTQQDAAADVSGKSPFPTDQDSFLDPESDATFTEAMINAGPASAALTAPGADTGLGEVPVSDLPAPPPMRPFGWQANQDMPDPDVEVRQPTLTDEQQVRGLAGRDLNGRTGLVRSAGSVGSKENGWQSRAGAGDESQPPDDTDLEQPLSDKQVGEWEDQRQATFDEEDARPRPEIGDFGNGKANAEPAPQTTTSAAQEQADAAAMAASEAQEQADLAEEGATIKANGAQAQQEEQANVAASQAQNAAAVQQEQRTQANEAATQQQAEAGAQQAETEAANGAAAQEQANQAAAFQEQQQEEAAAALSRPAGGSDDATDLAGSDDGEVAVPETDSGDSETSDGSDEGTGAPEETYDGETPTTEQKIIEGISGNGGGGEADEGGGDFIEG